MKLASTILVMLLAAYFCDTQFTDGKFGRTVNDVAARMYVSFR